MDRNLRGADPVFRTPAHIPAPDMPELSRPFAMIPFCLQVRKPGPSGQTERYP